MRVLIIRGSGGAFSSGTDITQFADLLTGEDGLAYERRIGAVVERLAGVRVPTIASVEGVAVGGGCAIAVACDLRICSDTAAFGVPVARTLGNCLSLENTARLADSIGPGRVADLLMTGRLVKAEEALAWGLATTVVPAADLDGATGDAGANAGLAGEEHAHDDQGDAAPSGRASPARAGSRRRPRRRLLRQCGLPRRGPGVRREARAPLRVTPAAPGLTVPRRRARRHPA